MNRASRRRSRGQTLVVFAVVFAFVLFGLVCLVGDATYLFSWSNRLEAAAQLAAQSGADAVDPRFLYAGCGLGAAPCTDFIVDVNPADRSGALYAFQRACVESGDQSAAVPATSGGGALKTADDPQSPEGTACMSDGCHVFAEVTRVLQLPVPFPGFPASVTVRGTAYAAPVVGSFAARTACSGGPWLPAAPP